MRIISALKDNKVNQREEGSRIQPIKMLVR